MWASFTLFYKIYFIYLKGRIKERKRQRSSIHWLRPQKAAVTRAGPGGSQEAGALPSLPHRCKGTSTCVVPAAFPVGYQEVRSSEVEPWDLIGYPHGMLGSQMEV